MNPKMTYVADEIGRSICKYYEAEYLDFLFSGNIVIEDVIFQVLVECCRYAYLRNTAKHSLKYYIDRDGMELELERKNLKRVISYVNERFELEGKMLKESIGVEILKPDVRPVKPANRFPSYELSEFQYWELCNIHDMDLVKAIIEKRIGSSKKISDTRFTSMAEQFDSVIKEQEKKFGRDPESSVFSSLVLFTLETKYSFNFFYELAEEMEKAAVSEIPDVYNRIMTMAGGYKCTSPLPDICPKFAHDDDRVVEYPMILQRRRFLQHLIHIPEDDISKIAFADIMEANVLANAVQSHIYLNGKPMRLWFAEDTNLEDWASVFETFNVFRTFVRDKEWSPFKIRAIRKMYEAVSLDYKASSRKSSIEN